MGDWRTTGCRPSSGGGAPLPARDERTAIVSQVSIYRFLFRLAADSRRIPPERLLQRLVTGLANRYGAAGCSLYRYGRGRATCWAPPGPPLTQLSQEDRAYLHNLDGRLVQTVMSEGYFVSALDLDHDGDITQFLENQLDGMYVFAFPLLVDEGPRGALVMYLPQDSEALGDGDIQALMALGEVLQTAEEQGPRLRQAVAFQQSKVRAPHRASGGSRA